MVKKEKDRKYINIFNQTNFNFSQQLMMWIKMAHASPANNILTQSPKYKMHSSPSPPPTQSPQLPTHLPLSPQGTPVGVVHCLLVDSTLQFKCQCWCRQHSARWRGREGGGCPLSSCIEVSRTSFNMAMRIWAPVDIFHYIAQAVPILFCLTNTR